MIQELRCKLLPGQFSTEFAVVVETFNGQSYSLFASMDDVTCEEMPTQDVPTVGWLRVGVIERGDDTAVVRLPQSTIENGQYLSVKIDQLRDAAIPLNV